MSETPKVFESEYRFLQILWEHEPVGSTQLVKLCKEGLGWSKATTYTVIRRLSERGVVSNEETIVRSLVSRQQVQESQIDELVERTFGGSIPQFVAAFTQKEDLSREDVEQIRQMLDKYETEGFKGGRFV